MSVALLVRAFLWLWFASAVAAGHWLLLQRVPPLVLPAAILALSVGLVAVGFRIPALRAWILAIDLRTLILLHVLRLGGIYFLVLHQAGDLPRAFAVPAGMGETVVAVMALPVVFVPLGADRRRRAIRIWSMVGLIDILVVVFTITRLNLAGPLHLLSLTRLPLSLYPTFLLPLLIATHVIVLHRSGAAERAA